MIKYPDPYPLYTVPEHLDKFGDEMDREEARAHFTWFIQNYIGRVNMLLGYFDEELTGDAPADIARLSEKVASCLDLDWCTYMPDKPMVMETSDHHIVSLDPERSLTIYGKSLAIDMGLLVAHLLLTSGCEGVKWHLVTRPRSDSNYHCPVIFFKHFADWNPKRNSIGILFASIDRNTAAYKRWSRVFETGCKRSAENT